MSDRQRLVIALDNVTRVYQPDEVDTHALSTISFEIARGDYVAIAGPSLRQDDAAVDSRSPRSTDERHVLAQQEASGGAHSSRARPCPEPGGRLHLSELQPDVRVDGPGQRRAPVELPWPHSSGQTSARQSRTRSRRHVPSGRTSAEPALRRAAAARRGRAGGGRRAADPARRRTDLTPRLQKRRGHRQLARRVESDGPNDLHGDARPAIPGLAQRTIHLFDGRLAEPHVELLAAAG